MHRWITLLGIALIAACTAAQQPGPSREETAVTRFRARVDAVDLQTRVVALVRDDGERLTFRADEGVRNLEQVNPGDVLVGELVENLLVEARPATAEEQAAPASIAGATAGAPLGQKPAGLFVRELKAVFTIDSIDRPRGGGELRDAAGNLQFVKARDPAVLDRLRVGDTVVVTYTQALRLQVLPGR